MDTRGWRVFGQQGRSGGGRRGNKNAAMVFTFLSRDDDHRGQTRGSFLLGQLVQNVPRGGSQVKIISIPTQTNATRILACTPSDLSLRFMEWPDAPGGAGWQRTMQSEPQPFYPSHCGLYPQYSCLVLTRAEAKCALARSFHTGRRGNGCIWQSVWCATGNYSSTKR